MAKSGLNDPRTHTHNTEARFHEIASHLRSDIEQIDDPRAKAMFETAAEVIGGLEKAFYDFDAKQEPAWR